MARALQRIPAAVQEMTASESGFRKFFIVLQLRTPDHGLSMASSMTCMMSGMTYYAG